MSPVITSFVAMPMKSRSSGLGVMASTQKVPLRKPFPVVGELLVLRFGQLRKPCDLSPQMKHPVEVASADSTVSLAMKVAGKELLGEEEEIGERPLPFLPLNFPLPFLPLSR